MDLSLVFYMTIALILAHIVITWPRLVELMREDKIGWKIAMAIAIIWISLAYAGMFAMVFEAYTFANEFLTYLLSYIAFAAWLLLVGYYFYRSYDMAHEK